VGLARGLERRLERLVEGLSAAVFRGRVHPIDLANRLVREADLSVVDTDAGPTVPNEYAITLGADDLDEAIDREALVAELAATLDITAADRGWRLEGPVRITLVEKGTTGGTGITVMATTVPGTLPPWGWLVGADGVEMGLRPNRVLVGRAPGNDIRLDDPEVSRRHAVVWREAGKVWLADLGSSNGATVNGRPAAAPVEVAPGDIVGFGPMTLSFRPA
jgi:hypothetical protein